MNNQAEQEFKNWLDKNEIPYWYIQQDLETFSASLKRFFTKRPDFMILLPNLGFIFVDIKDQEPAIKYDKFYLSDEEVDKYVNLQRNFNIQVWFVISNSKYHYKTWFWAPLSKITKAGFVFETKDKMRKCYSVPINEFVQVSENDTLDRIFTKLFEY